VPKVYFCFMRIDIVSVLPELIKSPFEASILKRARDKGLVDVYFHDLKPFSTNAYGSVDDYQYGGGAGMVMRCEPIAACIEGLMDKRTYDSVIYLTPDGERLNQKICNVLSMHKNILMLCGHYKGVDQRIRDHYITHEISIGDYVLSGGELGAAVLSDAIIRLIPGVLNDETSALTDSFQDDLLAPPVYTRPEEWNGLKVPEILRSGNFKKIEEWRYGKAVERTRVRRPDLDN